MSGRLDKQTVLITGASAGIGRACAIALAREGAHIVATGRREPRLRELISEIGDAGGSAAFISGDLNDRQFVDELAGRVGVVDILVNNAGILKYVPFIEMDLDDMDAIIATNLSAPLRLTHWIAKGMAQRRRGHIIMITSGAARRPVPLGLVYTATKHAMSGAARVLRMELQDQGLRVTEIAPGSVDTNIRDTSTHPLYRAKMASRSYDLLAPDDVASAVVYAATLPENCTTHLIEIKPRFGPSA